MIYDRVALIGLGLIASSMAHAMKAGGLAGEVVGYAPSAATRTAAEELGFCTSVAGSAAEAVAGADLVVLAVPVGVMGAVAAEIAGHLKPGAVVTDVGSVKQSVIAAVTPLMPEGVTFIGGHPIAGTEHSGPRAGFAALFRNRWWLLTPTPGTDRDAVARLRLLCEGMGARVDEMDPAHHDLVLAVTSHAPHLIAYTMVGVADDLGRVTDSEVVNYSAAGFRDFTRIAASDPTMWRDVFLTNKDATLEILGRFTEELFALQRAIRLGDGPHLHAYFTRTRAIRRGIIEAGQDTAAPDFGRGAPAAPQGAESRPEAAAPLPRPGMASAEGEATRPEVAARPPRTGADGTGAPSGPGIAQGLPSHPAGTGVSDGASGATRGTVASPSRRSGQATGVEPVTSRVR